MISNQILQSTIDGLKSITRKELSVVEKEGKVIATTEENMIGRQIDAVEIFISSPAESQLILGYQYFKIYDNGVPEYVILVKELREKETADEIDRIAKTIEETLDAETNSRVYISSGTIVSDLKDVSRSYKEAKMALEVGKIFETDKYIVNYEKLGIGRLIYQLPLPLCRMFIKEVLHGLTMDDFDDETLATVNKFFENNLNVSETSRQLYIHRNTLVYRLDKLQKMTGLDLRNFDDAIIFKITLMVSKYMIYMDKMAY